ncbi:TPA: hypothetical protein ACLM4Z_004843 [Pseudomonas aeruginosa]
MSDYKAAFNAAAADLSAIIALLGFTKYPGVDPVLRAITDLILDKAENQVLREERDAALARVEQQERTIVGMNEAHAKLAGLYEAAQAQHSVPDGWKLVPVEPTPEMLDARRDCEDGMDGYLVEDTEYYFPDRGAVRAFLARVYQGLIAAAPAPGGER